MGHDKDATPSKQKDQVVVEFAFEIKRAEGLNSKWNDSQLFVKWSCDSKKVSDGKSYAAICSDSVVEWNSANGDNLASFATTMYLDSKRKFSSREFTLAVKDKKSNKSIGSVKVDLADISNYHLQEEKTFSLSSNSGNLICLCSASWQQFNGKELEIWDGEAEDNENFIEFGGKVFKIGGDGKKLKRYSSITHSDSSKKLLKRVSSFKNKEKEKKDTDVKDETSEIDDESETSESTEEGKKKKRRLSRIISDKSLKFPSHKRKKSLTHDEKSESEQENDDNSEGKSEKEKKTKSKKSKSLTRSVSSTGIGKHHENSDEHGISLSQFKKRKGMNTMKVRFDMSINDITQLPSKCVGKQIQITWKRGAKDYNAGKSDKKLCSGHSVELNSSFSLQCNLYQQQQPPFSFEEQNLLFSLRYDSGSGKYVSLAKGSFDLSKCSADDSNFETIFELKNSKGLSVKMGLKCHTSWLSINDEPIAGAEPIDTSHAHSRRLSRVLSFKSKKKLTEELESNSNLEHSESDEMKQLKESNSSLNLEIEELRKKLELAENQKDNKNHEESKSIPSIVPIPVPVEDSKEFIAQKEELQKTLKQIESMEEERNHLQSKLKELEAMNLSNIEQATKTIDKTKKRVSKMESNWKKSQNECTELKETISSLQTKLDDTQKQLTLRQQNDSELLTGTQEILDKKIKDFDNLQSEYQKLREEKESILAKRKKTKKTLSTQKAQLATLTAELAAARSQVSDETPKLQKQIDDLTKQLKKVERGKKKSSEELKSLQKEHSKQKEDFKKEIEKLESEKTNTINSLQKELLNTKEQHQSTLSQIDKLNTQIQELQEKQSSLTSEIEKKEKQLVSSQKKLQSAEKKLENEQQLSTEAANEESLKEIKQLQTELDEIQMKLIDAESEITIKDSKLSSIMEENKKLNDKIEEFSQEKSRTLSQFENNDEQMKQLQQKLLSQDEEIKKLKDETDNHLQNISNLESQNKTMKEEQEREKEKEKEKERESENTKSIEETQNTAKEETSDDKSEEEKSDEEKSDEDKSDEDKSDEEKSDESKSESTDDSESESESYFDDSSDESSDDNPFKTPTTTDFQPKGFGSSFKSSSNGQTNDNNELKTYKFIVEKICSCPLEFDDDKPLITCNIMEYIDNLDNSSIPQVLSQIIGVLSQVSQVSNSDLFIQGYWLNTSYSLLQDLQSSHGFKDINIDKIFSNELSENSEISEGGLEECQYALEKHLMKTIELFILLAGKILKKTCLRCFFPAPLSSVQRKENMATRLLRTLDTIAEQIDSAKLNQELSDRLMEGIFEFINAIIFNELMNDSKKCTMEVGIHIKYILSQITEWLMNTDILENVLSSGNETELRLRMMPLTHAATALVVLVDGSLGEVSSIEELQETFSSITMTQLNKLIKGFSSDGNNDIPMKVQKLVSNAAKNDESDEFLFELPFNINV